MKKIDLHCHSNYSDGEYSVNELINMAIKKNLEILAITDHDSIDCIKYLEQYKFTIESNLTVIGGIEFSSSYCNNSMHIVGYNIDCNNEEIIKKTNELKSAFMYYIIEIITILKLDFNVEFTKEEVINLLKQNKKFNRVDIARLLIDKGYAFNIEDAFQKYLIEIKNKLKIVDENLHPKKCIELINNAGGVAVLAHPKFYKLNHIEMELMLKELITYGLKGIEVFCPENEEKDIEFYLSLAKKYNLLVSGGSDYHGPINTPDRKLGFISNHLKNPNELSIIKELKLMR